MLARLIVIAFSLTCLTLNAQEIKKALFLGNSYTYFNNLPQLVDNFAQSAGNDLIYDSNTPGGYQMNQHASNPITYQKINQNDWDFVVIQGQSQEPSFSPAQVASDVYPYAAIINDSLLSANPCIEPMFFMTWGRKNGDASNCGFYPPICTYDGMQQRLKESYMEMANDNNASVAPVGVAWKAVRDLYPNIELYTPDESHPSAAGSYLAASVFYVSMFRESIVNSSFEFTLDSLTAYRLRDIASSTVLDSLSAWRIGENEVNVSLANDTSLCADSLFLSANGVFDSITWSTGETNMIALVDTSSSVWVEVKNKRNCMASDTIEVELINGQSPNLNDNLQVFGHGDAYLYLDSTFWDSIYYHNIYDNSMASNTDTMFFQCVFDGYIAAWNACGMDSMYFYTSCASITELEDSWRVMPVPFTTTLEISSNETGAFAFEIQDLMGRRMLYSDYSEKNIQNVNLDFLPIGNYILLLFDKQHIVLGQRIIQKR